MAEAAALEGGHSYQSLQEKYRDFSHPVAQILLGGTPISAQNEDVVVNDVQVELTSGFEASLASFRIYGAYDMERGGYLYDSVSGFLELGKTVEIQMGYLDNAELVFAGYITGMTFGYEEGSLPFIEVTAMDVKGVLMGGSYACSLTAKTYSDAVKEILDRSGLYRMSGTKQKLGEPIIENTPDAQGTQNGNSSSPITMEMVGESDYEFIVRAAKRYNFEFFVDRGVTVFRPAKKNTTVLMDLAIGSGLRDFHITYSVTGVVGNVEARAMNPGTGKCISSKQEYNTIIPGETAGKVVGSGARVYVDPSIQSQSDADSRAKYMMERMSYRLGELEALCVGIPELVPGRFINVSGLGKPVDNRFYITKVIHSLDANNGYSTRLEGCASAIKAE